MRSSGYHLLIILVAVSLVGLGAVNQKDHSLQLKRIDGTCSDEELNHSPLVECKSQDCSYITQDLDPIWPSDRNHLVHMHSSRSGNRFLVDNLENLNYRETEQEKLFDINTTLYVHSTSRFHEVLGFGATLDAHMLMLDIDDESLYTSLVPILTDLFSKSPKGIELSILRLPITSEVITNYNITHLMHRVDTLITRVLGRESGDRIRVIVNLEDLRSTMQIIEALKAIPSPAKKMNALDFWAVSLNQEWIFSSATNKEMLEYVKELFSTNQVLGVTKISESPSFTEPDVQSIFGGLLIKSEFSAPYNFLDSVRSTSDKLTLITIGSDKPQTSDYGDWQNAQNYAVEILKHLTHGSNGFIEGLSVVDVLSDSKSQDCSIYSLQRSHQLHFRGPMFYAIGHFSRLIKPGSRRLAVEVYTQPNMFAAHYAAFATPQNQIVAIVLNDNEHLLPFRLAVDGKILSQVNLEPKSFNTIVVQN